METYIAHGPSWDIDDAKNRVLQAIDSHKMPVRLGRFIAVLEFIIYEKLEVPLIVGADSCDKFVEAV